MKLISEPKNPNELWCGECKLAGVFTEAQKKQSGGLVPLSLLRRCDQMRPIIQRSSRVKSNRTCLPLQCVQ
jgi:hypothetical protein